MARGVAQATLTAMSNPTQPTTRPTVLIVDADRRVRGSLSALLELEQGVTVVGVAGDAATAIDLVDLHTPDVVVLDPRLPDVDAGIALLAYLRRRLPAARLVVCACSDLVEGATALDAADAVLAKGVDPGVFVASVLGKDWAVVAPSGSVPAASVVPAAAAEAAVDGAPFARLPAGNPGKAG